jgi:hypothetical protein
VWLGEPLGTDDCDSLISVNFKLNFLGSMLPTSPATLNPSPFPWPHVKKRGDLIASTQPHPYLPSQPRCKDRRWHGPCLCFYRCPLPHFVDCCLPLQFLLLSAIAIAIVAAAATAETASAAVAITIRPHRHLN